MTHLPASPASSPPEFPEDPPSRFQFHIKHLLAFMFASAILAACARYMLQVFERLPVSFMTSWMGVTLSSLAIGAVLYFILRVPFLGYHAARLGRRWHAIQMHRLKLTEWAKGRRAHEKRIMNGDGEREA